MTPDSALRVLRRRGQLTWRAMQFGLQRGWMKREDVAHAAADWLAGNPDSSLQPALLLAACEGDDVQEVSAMLGEANTASTRETEGDAALRWRWAFLAALADDCADGEVRLQRLQEVYAEFGFPPDMADCSRYHAGQPGESPLAAMRRVIADLGHRISAAESRLSPEVLGP